MRKLSFVVGLLSVLALSACKKEEAKPAAPTAAADAAPVATPPPAEPPDAAPAADPGGGSGGGTGKMENKMANCPSAVAGASTAVNEAKDGVEVVVTAKDAAAVKEIQDRSKKLAEAAKSPDAAEVQHTGKGTGGGEIGFCPVVLKDTTVEYAEQKDGAKLTVKPSKPENLAALVTESKRRLEAMPKAGEGGGGTGGGGGEPGPGGPGSGTGGGGGGHGGGGGGGDKGK
jgi:TusA-related sulfurtransferase